MDESDTDGLAIMVGIVLPVFLGFVFLRVPSLRGVVLAIIVLMILGPLIYLGAEAYPDARENWKNPPESSDHADSGK